MRLAYTLEALAEETGKSRDYWWGLIFKEHQLGAKRLGKTPLVLASEYESFLESLPDA
jgi:hypothetical protein